MLVSLGSPLSLGEEGKALGPGDLGDPGLSHLAWQASLASGSILPCILGRRGERQAVRR